MGDVRTAGWRQARPSRCSCSWWRRLLRLWSLPSPPSLYWDEQYYVFDAEVYLGGGIGQPVGDPPPVKIADEGRGSTRRSASGSSRSSGWGRSACTRSAGGSPRRCSASRASRCSTSWPCGSGARVVGGVRGVPARFRRPAHRPEPDGHARHLPVDVHHRRLPVPGAGPRAAGRRGRPRRRGGVGSSGSSARPAACGPASASGRRSRRNGPGVYALVFGACCCAPCGLPAADRRASGSRRSVAGRSSLSFAVVPLAVYLAELRRLLLPARPRHPRLPDAADAGCSSTRSTI